MNRFTLLIRRVSKWRFKRRRLYKILYIPTDEFNQLLKSLLTDGWKLTYEYAGFDAWIDYGCVKLKKGGVNLKCEWDNWGEGSIEGHAATVLAIADRFGYKAVLARRQLLGNLP